MTHNLTRKLVAEALGTGLLVATVVGSGIMAERLSDDVAVQLLGNTIPTGAILVVLIMTFGPISGAHFNPAVTLAFLIRREIALGAAVAYVLVQVAGGVLGTWVAHGMFDVSIFQVSEKVRTGGAQWFSEVVAAFGLVLVILLGVKQRVEAVPVMVGLYITAAYWFTASTSFANPAVAIARSLTDTFSGIRPSDVPGFVLAQIAGAVLAAIVAYWLYSGDGDTRRN